MNEANLALWLDDLRSTTRPQAREQLAADGHYCCLGRLCEVAADNGCTLTIVREPGLTTYDGQIVEPPAAVAKWLGAYPGNREIEAVFALGMRLNDEDKLSFAQIADEIESFLTEP